MVLTALSRCIGHSCLFQVWSSVVLSSPDKWERLWARSDKSVSSWNANPRAHTAASWHPFPSSPSALKLLPTWPLKAGQEFDGLLLKTIPTLCSLSFFPCKPRLPNATLVRLCHIHFHYLWVLTPPRQHITNSQPSPLFSHTFPSWQLAIVSPTTLITQICLPQHCWHVF